LQKKFARQRKQCYEFAYFGFIKHTFGFKRTRQGWRLAISAANPPAILF
jgi:hypothetical protein